MSASSTSGNRRSRRWFRWLAVALGLVILEAGARLAERPRLVTELRFPAGDLRAVLHRAVPGELGYELAPGATLGELAHDSLGFRDVERPLAKPPGTFRILALGDSITYGAGIPLANTYPKVLESLLASAGAKVEVWNGGVIGYNARQEALWLERHGLGIQPDLVLIGACANDLGPRQLETSTRDGLVIREYAPPLVPLVLGSGRGGRLVASHSALARFADRLAARVTGDPSGAPLLDPQAEANAASYATIRERSAAAGAATALMVFPMLGATDGGLEAIRRRILEIAGELGIPALDLAEPFRALPPLTLRLNADDPWHPNATGHALAAQVAARFLRERGLIPEAPPARLSTGGTIDHLASDAPRWSVPWVTRAPAIDGRLDGDVWPSLAPRGDFVSLPEAADPPSRATLAWLARDSSRLYAAFRSSEARPERLRGVVQARDGDRIWEDDDVELFLAPDDGQADGPYFQVIVNASGAVYDREHRGREVAWNAEGLEVAVGREDDAWTVEIALPFAALGRASPASDENWRGNLARHVSAGNEPGEWLTWTPLPRDSLLQPERMGTLHFLGPR